MKPRKFYPLLILAVGLVAYHNSFFGPFVFDDVDAIVKNSDIHQVWPLGRVMFGSAHTPLEGRPVSCLAFALQYAWSHLDVVGYHIVNVGLHLAVGSLLWAVLQRTFQTSLLREQFGAAASELALVITLLWLVHPLNTECVTYLVQRTELLVGLAWMLVFYGLLRSVDSSRRIGWYALAIVSCLLGMGSKEVMVTAPFLAFLYDRTFLAGSFREAWQQRRPLYVGLAATWIFLLLLDAPDVSGHASKGTVLWSAVASFFSRGDHAHSSFFDSQFSVWDTPRTESGVILYYLRLWFWPSPLVIDYYDWPVVKLWSQAWLSMSIVVIMLSGVVWGILRRPVWGFLGAWFFLILAPTSSIIPLHEEFVAERRLYLPMISLLCATTLLANLGLDRLAKKASIPPARRNWIAILFVGMAVLSLASATIRRNEDYRSAVSLWTDTVARRPLNARAESNLASALGQLGATDEAIVHYRTALRLNPRFSAAQHGFGITLSQQEKLGEAMEHLLLAVQLNPTSADIHCSLGIVLSKQGKFPEAMEHLNLSLRLDPSSPLVYNSLGIVLAKQGQLEPAIAQFQTALRLQPDHAEARANLEHALSMQKLNKSVPPNPPLAPTP